MIQEAADLCKQHKCVIVLGCGPCVEIPVESLAKKFTDIDFVEQGERSLRLLKCKTQQLPSQVRMNFYHADLTGLIQKTEAAAHKAVDCSNNAEQCIDKFCDILNASVADFWQPPASRTYDLVICSVLLTQLELSVREKLNQVFACNYPNSTQLLSDYDPWRTATWNFARKLEENFIRYLDSLVAPGGIIYLSSTIQVSLLKQVNSNWFVSDGAWIMTKTAQLEDYLTAHHSILQKNRWNWLSTEHTDEWWGRLYGVQGLIYKHHMQ